MWGHDGMQTYLHTGTGGGDDSSGHSNEGSGSSWPGWEARVAADPQFVYKVMVEQVRHAQQNQCVSARRFPFHL